MNRVPIVAAASRLTACPSMPAHDVAAMGHKDLMCCEHMNTMQGMHKKMTMMMQMMMDRDHAKPPATK